MKDLVKLIGVLMPDAKRLRIFCRILSLVLMMLFLSSALCAQVSGFKKEEDSLRNLSRRMYAADSDSAKMAAGAKFSKLLQEVLQKPGIYAWPFDSLRDIGCLRAPDDAFRIFNWNLPLRDRSSRYYGYILMPEGHGMAGKIIVLHDSSDSIADATNMVLPASRWYGALYYSILKQVWEKKIIYTLLAWDGYSARSSRKIIDILTFDPEGIPRFGLPVFKTADGLKSRVIYEYAGNAVMLLRYDNQLLVTGQRSNGRPKTIKTGMIVADRLVPIDPRLKGQFEYYVPAGDTYDAFIYRQGYWKFVEDVMVTNPSAGKKTKATKPVEYNLLPVR